MNEETKGKDGGGPLDGVTDQVGQVTDQAGEVAGQAPEVAGGAAKQAQDTVLECWTVELPQRTIADRAFDSDALDQSLAEFGVEVIAAHRKRRKRQNKTQDGRKLRRYKRRWKVERFFSCLGNFRHLLIRHERKVRNYEGFAHLATLIILVRNCF